MLRCGAGDYDGAISGAGGCALFIRACAVDVFVLVASRRYVIGMKKCVMFRFRK